MANVIKRAALAFGRWTGICRKPAEFSDLVVIEPVAEAIAEPVAADPGVEALGSIDDLMPLGGPLDAAWDDEQAVTSETIAPPLEEVMAVTAGQIDVASEMSVTATDFPPIVVADAVTTTETVVAPAMAEEANAPIEMKPIPQPEPSVTFTQLYELISTEVNKRTDNAVTVYERLLTATREELDATRKSNRLAWSVGGVMTAVAAFGAIWAAGEVSATRVEVAGLKQQVTVGQQASAERDLLRADLLKTREASAKIEVDALKSRLDQALAVSTDRDRLRGELDTLRKAKQEVEGELRLARAATTQPVSQAQPAAGRVVTAAADKASGAERPDVWSILLNGKDDH